MTGYLTTHVLDTAQGIPATGMKIILTHIPKKRPNVIGIYATNMEGRTNGPLVVGDDFIAGTYELIFFVDEYFAGQELATTDPPFLDRVTIRFTVADPAQHYHVPLLVSPWSYSTYRGS